jgi:hypothetical protein
LLHDSHIWRSAGIFSFGRLSAPYQRACIYCPREALNLLIKPGGRRPSLQGLIPPKASTSRCVCILPGPKKPAEAEKQEASSFYGLRALFPAITALVSLYGLFATSNSPRRRFPRLVGAVAAVPALPRAAPTHDFPTLPVRRIGVLMGLPPPIPKRQFASQHYCKGSRSWAGRTAAMSGSATAWGTVTPRTPLRPH